jgi:endonuclease IV
MKTHDPLRKIFLIVIATFFIAAVHGCGPKKETGGVTIQTDEIIVHAGTKLSEDDEKALNDVLKNYDKKLYLVEKFQEGKLTKRVGELKIDTQLESEVAKAKAMGITDSTVNFVPGGGRYGSLRKEDVEKLVQELKPILEKYSKQ